MHSQKAVLKAEPKQRAMFSLLEDVGVELNFLLVVRNQLEKDAPGRRKQNISLEGFLWVQKTSQVIISLSTAEGSGWLWLIKCDFSPREEQAAVLT